MTVHLAELTWEEAGQAALDNLPVIVPAGATEAHGQHLPLDVDTHQAATVAARLAERAGALVAPALPYGYSTMWMGFPGTITLSSETFQQVLVEVCSSLVRHGFYRVVILNGHRPNGTACDCAARRVVDAFATSCRSRSPPSATGSPPPRSSTPSGARRSGGWGTRVSSRRPSRWRPGPTW